MGAVKDASSGGRFDLPVRQPFLSNFASSLTEKQKGLLRAIVGGVAFGVILAMLGNLLTGTQSPGSAHTGIHAKKVDLAGAAPQSLSAEQAAYVPTPPQCPGIGPSWREPIAPFQERDLSNCGNWQATYKKMHADMLAGKIPGRRAVAGGVGGLAPSLAGAVSVFYYALLTGRAFHMTIAGDEPRWEWAYDAPHIDWTVSPGVYPRAGEAANGTLDGKKNIQYYVLSQDEPGTFPATAWSEGNLTALGDGAETVYFEASADMTLSMFDNKFLSRRLHRMGVRPETAVGCALRFLVQPSKAVAEAFAEETAGFTEATLKVGMHIQQAELKNTTQEAAMKIADIAAWLNCVKQVDPGRKVSDQQPTLWYLVSDSGKAFELAHSFSKGKLVDTRARVAALQGDAKSKFISEVGENYVLGLTNVQVIGEFSGFGKLAALRALRPNSVYLISNQTKRGCSIHEYNIVRDLVVGRGSGDPLPIRNGKTNDTAPAGHEDEAWRG